MKTNKLFFVLVLTLCSAQNTYAYDFVVDGIYYNKTSDTTIEVASYDKYKGDIIIPSVVSYNSVDYSVTSIGISAFNECRGLISVTIPNSVTSIGDYAFCECSGLTSITIPNSVTSIGLEAFKGCSGLTSITIPNSVTSIGGSAFYNCSSLTSITIPNSVTSIGNSAFYNCSSLTSITIGNSVTSIGNSAFRYCRGLTSVTIPNSVTSIGDYAFCECSGLTSITIPNSVTSIGNSAFWNCSDLTSITIGNSVTYIGLEAFKGCSGLTSITIPNSVTSIGGSAFYGCYRLTTISVFNSVPPICGGHTFNCSNLRDDYDIYTYVTLHVPMGSEELYSSAHDWRYFNKIKGDMASNGNVYYVNLVVQQGTTGYTRQAIKAAEKYTIYIGSLGDNKVNAVTFNGVDVTDEVKDGYYTTPELKNESILSVSYETKTSDVKSTTLNKVRITGYNGEMNICNIDVASDVKVYTVDGKIVDCIPSALGDVSLQVSSNQLYIVKIGKHTYKIAL